MSYLPQGSNSDNDFPRQGRHTGGISGGVSGCGLSTPWILYDTRNHDGTGVPLVEGYPNNPPLVNEGIGGDKWDLQFELAQAVDGAFYIIPYKTLNWPNSFGTSGTNHPTTWDDIGGRYCEAGGITYMMAVGTFGYTYNSPTTGSRLGYIESDFIFDDGLFAEWRAIFHFDDWQGADFGPAIWSNFQGIYPGDGFFEFYPGDQDYLGNYLDIENKLLTIHWDPHARQVWRWVDTELVKITWLDYKSGSGNPIDPLGEDHSFFELQHDCKENEIGADDGPATEVFIYQGDAGPYSTLPGLGTAWNPMKGAAMFRGRPPCQPDIEEWYDYFFDGDPGAVMVTLGYSWGRSGLGDTDPHSATYTLPSGDWDGIRIHVSPARSPAHAGLIGRVVFDIVAGAGDVITVELGGRGGNFASGQGGWPDGGQGGVSLVAGNYGAGGSGSSRFYLNGTLVAIIGGGGGGTYAGNTPGPISSISNLGAVVGDNITTNDGLDGEPAASALRGRAGTTSGAGAGGWGSGAGSGSIGGIGEPSTYVSGSQRRSGGGGGGGGLFGGGGGGAASSNSPGSGASGSHWFHPTLTQNSNLWALKSSSASSIGVSASAFFTLLAS